MKGTINVGLFNARHKKTNILGKKNGLPKTLATHFPVYL